MIVISSVPGPRASGLRKAHRRDPSGEARGPRVCDLFCAGPSGPHWTPCSANSRGPSGPASPVGSPTTARLGTASTQLGFTHSLRGLAASHEQNHAVGALVPLRLDRTRLLFELGRDLAQQRRVV